MIATLPALTAMQFYIANAIKNLGGLGFKAWMPSSFQTDDRIWKSDGRIVTPSTEVVNLNGHRIERNGLLNNAIANRLRISRGLSAPTQIGALIEEARTNICLRSEELENSPWNEIRVTVTANDITAPDGASTADKIVEDSSSSTTHHLNQSISWVSGNAYAISFYAKADERDEIRLRLQATAFPANANVFFNLATGNVGTIAADIDDAYMTPVRGAPGWFRCVAIATATSTTSGDIEIYLTSGSEVFSYTGDGSSGAHVWGTQVEIASNSAASSYIETIGSTVTRAADNLAYSNTGEQLIEATEGTIIIVVTPGSDAAAVTIRSEIIETREASQDNGFLLQIEPTSNLYNYEVRSGVVTVAALTSTTVPTRGVTDVIVIIWKLNDFRLIINGALETSDTIGASPLILNAKVFIGQRFGNIRMFNGLIGPWLSFRRALTLRQANDVVKNVIQPIYPGRLRMAA